MSVAAAAPGRGRWMLALAALALTMLLWAGNTIVARWMHGEIPPFMLAFVRWTGAFLIVLPFAWRHVATDRDKLLGRWPVVLILALTGVASFNAFLYSGLQFTTATNASLLQAAIPPMVLVADRLIFGIRSARAQLIGVSLAAVGVIIIVCRGSPSVLVALHFGVGDVLVLCGVLAWATYTSLLRLRPEVHPLSLLAVTFAIGALTMAPLAMLEVEAIRAMPLTAATFFAFAYVAFFPSVVAYLLYNSAVAEVGSGVAGQAISLLPLFGAGLAALLLGEALHGYHAVGMAVIAVGIGFGAFAARATP
ncbi:DMT family transporter [Sphingomonas sp. M1-B02]|uniref:DMT family transporter n=1 Tax=Sphingomonas sp. M1-B02 TaxID=3114300 RepID=UPI00223F0651|nr:DMT family transporter [Sphingomonas sp. S6-11]UZK66541.1 DMT family transporter [Sphingomonas sp. S6-11]